MNDQTETVRAEEWRRLKSTNAGMQNKIIALIKRIEALEVEKRGLNIKIAEAKALPNKWESAGEGVTIEQCAQQLRQTLKGRRYDEQND